jgi:ADP-ribosyl-[dinitrogen reductase] hydrolase
MDTNFTKEKGALLGVAIGDALGATLEFMTREEIKKKYGLHRDITGGGCWHLSPGEVTDDTDMTLCVAKGILAEPENPIGRLPASLWSGPEQNEGYRQYLPAGTL